jgi:hypothetical protein
MRSALAFDPPLRFVGRESFPHDPRSERPESPKTPQTPWEYRHPGSTFTARAITRIAVTSDMHASIIMAIFAQVRNGRVSVGLNAVAFVNET